MSWILSLGVLGMLGSSTLKLVATGRFSCEEAVAVSDIIITCKIYVVRMWKSTLVSFQGSPYEESWNEASMTHWQPVMILGVMSCATSTQSQRTYALLHEHCLYTSLYCAGHHLLK